MASVRDILNIMLNIQSLTVREFKFSSPGLWDCAWEAHYKSLALVRREAPFQLLHHVGSIVARVMPLRRAGARARASCPVAQHPAIHLAGFF